MSLTIHQLCNLYQAWAEGYYRKPSGRPTRAANNVRDALRELREARVKHGEWLVPVGRLPLASMSPRLLRAVQQVMADSGRLCRKTVNERIATMQRMVRWAAQQEMVPDTLPGRLELVEPLKRGRTPAQDNKPVQPVKWETVCDTLTHAPSQLAAMIELQWHTGMRPGEVCLMAKSAIDRSGETWVYRPIEHKTEHHDHERVIALGPLAQSTLGTWWPRVQGDWLFPGRCGQPMRELSYYRAIKRINEAQGIAHWTPNQIRHSAATRIRREVGLEAARVILGHSSARTTEIYAQADQEKAIGLMQDLG